MKLNVDKSRNKIPSQTNDRLDINMRILANGVTASPVWRKGLQALAMK